MAALRLPAPDLICGNGTRAGQAVRLAALHGGRELPKEGRAGSWLYCTDLVRVPGGLGGEARLVRLVDLRARAAHLAGGGGGGGAGGVRVGV